MNLQPPLPEVRQEQVPFPCPLLYPATKGAGDFTTVPDGTITQVRQGSPAEAAGLRAGMKISHVTQGQYFY